MNLLLAGALTLRIIGIGVVTDQIRDDPGTHVIFPRIDGWDPSTPAITRVETPLRWSAIAQPFTQMNPPRPFIERHEVAILYKNTSRHPSSTWDAEAKFMGDPDNTSYVL